MPPTLRNSDKNRPKGLRILAYLAQCQTKIYQRRTINTTVKITFVNASTAIVAEAEAAAAAAAAAAFQTQLIN